MAIEGWYYLHTNGALIYKRELGGTAADIRESDFAVALWPVDPENREGAWRILVEALAAGANVERITELAAKWKCDDADAQRYAERIGVRLWRDGIDGASWEATRKIEVETHRDPPLIPHTLGVGATCLAALADLAKQLGYQPSKMWGATFADLVKSNG